MQKCGMRNSQGWAAYVLGEAAFIKRFDHLAGRDLPGLRLQHGDLHQRGHAGSRVAGPVGAPRAGREAVHVERWSLDRVAVGPTEAEIDAALLPLI